MSKYINVQVKKIILQGVCSSSSTTELVSSTQDFILSGVSEGDIIYNITDPEFSTVVAVVDANTITLDGNSSGFTDLDAFAILSPSLNEDFPVNIDSITKASIENNGGLGRINLNVKGGVASNANVIIILKDNISLASDRNLIIDKFMSDVNNSLASSYKPSFRETSNLGLTEYMYAYIDIV
jgi:hypothetical protein